MPLQFCLLYTQQFRPFENFYTIVWKLIYELLKNAHSLIHWGVDRQPNSLKMSGFQERRAFQSNGLMFAHPVYHIIILFRLRCTISKYPYSSSGRITPVVFKFSSAQAFIDFDIPVKYYIFIRGIHKFAEYLPNITGPIDRCVVIFHSCATGGLV